MKTITSSEFRKIYATLTEQTVVTALGREIGEWVPYVAQRVPPGKTVKQAK